MIKQIFKEVKELFLPLLCINCGNKIDRFTSSPIFEKNGNGANIFCKKCSELLEEIKEPFCLICGIPFKSKQALSHICGICKKDPPKFDKARSFLIYNEASSNLIHVFKYSKIQYIGKLLIKYFLEKDSTDLDFNRVNVIVPVPLTEKKIIKRGFNQSKILADVIGKEFKISVQYNLLKKARETEDLAGLTLSNRKKISMKDVFKVEKASLDGQNVLLVDDVFTSGTTLNACAKALKKAGKAHEVHCLTLARTVLS